MKRAGIRWFIGCTTAQFTRRASEREGGKEGEREEGEMDEGREG